ncbi:MAG: alpha/beta hydrolase [Lachnospiraceae bacterium]|nr:alpha/beta hydrolase [Lachnospiraceae bacterium]
MTYSGKKLKNKSVKPEKKDNIRANRKQWFALRHTTINHPRYKHAEEYDASKAWCTAQDMREWYIHSADGVLLHASYFPAENAKRFVILCHGYRGTRFGSVASIAKYLHENNCNLLFVDQRCCGESEGEYITFGAKEQYDVLLWLKRLEEENQEKLPVYFYGQSMGATTVLLASGHALPAEVRGIIADCGFHSMKQQIRDMAAGWFHIPWIGLMLLRVDFFCHIFARFAMKETDTTEALRRNVRPVLFFHGMKDTYVRPRNTKRNYALCTAEKEMVLVPKARHLCCSYEAPELYRQKVSAFFDKYDKRNSL